MLKKIESLRKQPEHVRNRFAFWTALFVTLIIAALWGSTLPARFENTQAAEEEEQGTSSWSTLSSSFQDFFKNGAAQFGKITVQQKTVEEPPQRIDLVELVASSTASTKEERSATGTATSSQSAGTSTFMGASSSPQGN